MFSCVPSTLAEIEAAISPARLGRYMPAAGGDKNLALRLYVWNSRLCEALYVPIQLTEVCYRNAMHRALLATYGGGWRTKGSFLCNLPDRLKAELIRVENDERKNHGSNLTNYHIVAGLSYGFWVHLLTRPFDHLLWKKGLRGSLPHAPSGLTREKAHQRFDDLRQVRNRIAHYYAVFDNRPTSAYQKAIEAIGWISPETQWFVMQNSDVSKIVNQRPLLQQV